MSRAGPILIIEDDQDDQEILQEAFTELGVRNKLLFFDKTKHAFDFLKTTSEKPFLILSDVNLPQQTGVEFKREVDSDPQLRKKSIPFVFFSTSIEKHAVDTAYKELTIQGFFQKSNNYQELKNVLSLIVEYWKVCQHPTP
jgi:CheY-like chemotaxis protein